MLLVRLALHSASTCPFPSLISCSTRLPMLAYLAAASASAETFRELHQQVPLSRLDFDDPIGRSVRVRVAVYCAWQFMEFAFMNTSVARLVRLHANRNNQRLPDFLRFLALGWMKFLPKSAIQDALWFTLLHIAAWLNTHYLVLDSSQVCRSCPSNLCNIACITASRSKGWKVLAAASSLTGSVSYLLVIATKCPTSKASKDYAWTRVQQDLNQIVTVCPYSAWNYGGTATMIISINI